MEEKKIRAFTDLETWKEGHTLVLLIYRQTLGFPKEEGYGLTSQMRRSAVSITSNIAEGFGRPSFTEKARFYGIARGSLTELYNQLLIAKDVNYLSTDYFIEAETKLNTVHRLLNALVTATKDRIT